MENRLTLRFAEDNVADIAKRYQYALSDKEVLDLKPWVQQRGHLTKEDLKTVARWKSPRSAGHVEKNSEDYVAEITQFALTTKCERARVESLTLLDGVSWPTASVILHFFHRDCYPILDVRALWSASDDESGDEPNQYTFEFWWRYVEFCRKTAQTAGVELRTLDRALWQYSKENQPH